MGKLLLIATLSLGTFAMAQPIATEMSDSQNADQDFYNQTVQQQADLCSRTLAANQLFSANDESQSSMEAQPGSMASDSGSQSADQDFYSRIVAKQANLNRLAKGI
jgi:hypothetical protein